MKVKVAVPVFRDKTTGTYHKQGAVITVTKERFDEIRKAGPFVEPIQAKKPGHGTEQSEQSADQPAEEPEPEPEPAPGPLHSYEGGPLPRDGAQAQPLTNHTA